jgi:hypothetical protein
MLCSFQALSLEANVICFRGYLLSQRPQRISNVKVGRTSRLDRFEAILPPYHKMSALALILPLRRPQKENVCRSSRFHTDPNQNNLLVGDQVTECAD